jgi:hypothetical protein
MPSWNWETAIAPLRFLDRRHAAAILDTLAKVFCVVGDEVRASPGWLLPKSAIYLVGVVKNDRQTLARFCL